MQNNPVLAQNRKSYLLALALPLALAALALFILFSSVTRFDTLLLSFFGLSCMGIALIIVISSSSHPMASLGVWFTVILALQHGGGWLLEQIFTDQRYTIYVYFADYNYTLAQSVALVGVGLLTFACAYAIVNSRNRKNNLNADCIAATRNTTIDQIPWSILLIWGVGYLIFAAGGGLKLFSASSTPIYLIRSIFGYLSEIVIILISLKLFTTKIKIGYVYLILITLWGGYVFLTGQRQYIIGISIATFVLASKWRLTNVKIKQLAVLGSFLLVALIGLIYLRAIFGRDTLTSLTLSQRLAVITSGQNTNQGDTNNTLAYDLGYRLNAGNILLGLMADLPSVDTLWIEPVTISITSLVPNILWTGKTQAVQFDLPNSIAIHYGITDVNYVATYFTAFFAMGGLPMLIFLAGFFGIMVAFLDKRTAQNSSILGFIMAIGLAWGLLSIDHGIDLLFQSLRNSFLVYLLIIASVMVKRALSKKL